MRLIIVLAIFLLGTVVGIWLGTWDNGTPATRTDTEAAPAAPASEPPKPAPENVALLLVDRHANDLESFLQDAAQLDPGPRLQAYQLYRDVNGGSFELSLAEATLALETGRPSVAVDLLLAAAFELSSAAQESVFAEALAAAVDQEARQLLAADRIDELDVRYEAITLMLPERAEYFLKLGILRLQAGNYDQALAVLSQIQNHHRYGASARELLEDAAVANQPVVTTLERLALTRRGDQFIVQAALDAGEQVSLLIDTGASMSVISQRKFESLGYSVQGPLAYFSTAGGVVEAPVMTLPGLSLGSARVRQIAVGVLAADFPEDIDGLLGMNFLRHFEFRIDQQSGELILESPR